MYQKPKARNGFSLPNITHYRKFDKARDPGRFTKPLHRVDATLVVDKVRNDFPDRFEDHVTVYGTGRNPFGEFGYPYKVNKQFVPPLLTLEDTEPLNRQRRERTCLQTNAQVPFQKYIDVSRTLDKKNRPAATVGPTVVKPMEFGDYQNAQNDMKVMETPKIQQKVLMAPRPEGPYEVLWEGELPKLETNVCHTSVHTGVHSSYRADIETQGDCKMIDIPLKTALNLKQVGPTAITGEMRQQFGQDAKFGSTVHSAVNTQANGPYSFEGPRRDPELVRIQNRTSLNTKQTNTSYQQQSNLYTELPDSLHLGSYENKGYIPKVLPRQLPKNNTSRVTTQNPIIPKAATQSSDCFSLTSAGTHMVGVPEQAESPLDRPPRVHPGVFMRNDKTGRNVHNMPSRPLIATPHYAATCEH